MSIQKIMFRRAIKQLMKEVLKVDSFELLRFAIDGDNVSWELDGNMEFGELDEEDVRQIAKMIPVKGFTKMVGDLRMDGLLVNITSIDKRTNEEYLEIFEI